MPYLPRFEITSRLLRSLEEIAALRQKTLSELAGVSWIPLFQMDSRTKAVAASAAVDRASFGPDEVRAIEEGAEPSGLTRLARRAISNQLRGLRFVERYHGKKYVTCPDLLRLHKIIATGVAVRGRPGRHRTFAVQIGPYTPPQAHELAGLMKELLAWWNQQAAEWSPVISSAILHCRFLEIRPFGDGNVRMAHMIARWELYRRKFDEHGIFPVDEAYQTDREQYFDQLTHARKARGDLTGWLEYSAEIVKQAIVRAAERARGIAAGHLAGGIVLTRRQERLLEVLSKRGVLTPRDIWAELQLSKQGAAKMVKPLLDTGMIRRVGTRKSGKYVLAVGARP
jgi:Fic family protein